jgi:hypothetical protein
MVIETATMRPATSFFRSGFEKRYQPRASTRLLRTMATAKVRPSPRAASCSRRDA